MARKKSPFLLFILMPLFAARLHAAPGTEGASFLDIPVGGGPAAMGAAYSAQADDVYATVWNPAGLGFLEGPQIAGTHQPYLETVHYEYFGYAQPLGTPDADSGRSRRGFGFSTQYLGSGDLDGRNEHGDPTGSFSSYFAAYSLAFGQRLSDQWAFGSTVKAITGKIDDASALTGAADLGLLYKPVDRLTLGAVAANLGPDLKFVNEGDPLPAAVRLGGTYALAPDWTMSMEGVYRRNGLLSGALGGEYRYGEYLAVRGGYNNSHTRALSATSGFTAGFGLYLFGQELDYAWTPFGELGTSYYVSVVLHFGHAPRSSQTLHKAASARAADNEKFDSSGDSDYQNLYDLLNPEERRSLKKGPAKPEKAPQ